MANTATAPTGNPNQAPQSAAKKSFGCLGCFVIALILFLTPVAVGAVMVAETGLVAIPVLTAVLYRPATPERLVRPLAGSTAQEVAATIGAGGHYDSETNLVQVAISEAQITTLAQDSLSSQAAATALPIKSIQVAIDPDAVELFVEIKRPQGTATVVARLVPQIKNGALTIAVQSLQLGRLAVPQAAAGALFNLAAGSILKVLETSVQSIGAIDHLALGAGKLSLFIQPPSQ